MDIGRMIKQVGGFSLGSELLYIYSSGSAYSRTAYLSPVVSLKTNVKLVNGNGSKVDPWELVLE